MSAYIERSVNNIHLFVIHHHIVKKDEGTVMNMVACPK